MVYVVDLFLPGTQLPLFYISCILTFCAFIFIGYLKAHLNEVSKIKSISETLFLGGIAAIVAFLAGTVLEKIIKSADLTIKDTVLEVGPGIGTLTQALANTAQKVIAVEKDKYMCQILKETLKDYKNIEVINDNILKTNLKLPKKY